MQHKNIEKNKTKHNTFKKCMKFDKKYRNYKEKRLETLQIQQILAKTLKNID